MKALLFLLTIPLLLGLSAPACQGQNGAAATALARGDSLLLDAHRPAEALEIYRERLFQDPQDFEALWRAARACLVLGIQEDDWDRRKAWHQEGEALGRRAEELRPSDINAVYWRIANQGRWAQEEPGPREVLRLAGEIREGADRILRADPNHAGAQNVLGMFYFEILNLNRFERSIARLLASSVVRNVRWADAHDHLRRALALDPWNILYHKDYGRALLWHGDTLEAREHFQRALDLPVTLPTDPVFQREAQTFLRQTGG